MRIAKFDLILEVETKKTVRKNYELSKGRIEFIRTPRIYRSGLLGRCTVTVTP